MSPSSTTTPEGPEHQTTTTADDDAPKTTKAWIYTQAGLPRKTLTLTTNLPYPVFPPVLPSNPEEEWLLVRVSYAALNPGEVIVMNLLPTFLRSTASAQKVPGYDLVGTVLDVWSPPSTSPESVRLFKKDDLVVAFLILSHLLAHSHVTGGALQEVVAIPAKYAVRVPDTKSPRDAAGLLLTGCTAAQMATESSIQFGDRVLVYGASGGVGSMAVQLARLAVGSYGTVVGVCSTRNVELVKELGADEVIDYTLFSGAVEDELVRRFGDDRKFDAVIDAFGSQRTYKRCAGFLREEGVYSAAGVHATGYGYGAVLGAGLVMLANAVWFRSGWLWGTGRQWKAVSMMDPGRELMERVVRLFGEGKLKVVADSEWEFEKVLEGYDILMSGRARGKVVVRVDSDGGE
ncbi:hypothetical protein B0H66DRAFT_166232 [Apodospora peruviana]|uniref:Enoyl reductase (ER) domain-containing protein n=1 Tax=Apodospora peruviana TaxID=516989 RepID=A0AAE0IK56_9PEZI|nr:hypothetical protein B0H66DRAFT_166232 [Apodospora peruviana]